MSDISINGYCYPPQSSQRKPAELSVRNDAYELFVDGDLVKSGDVHDLTFSDRIGSINRKIFFDSGTQFETADNDSVDQLLKTTRHKNSSSDKVNKLEASWVFATVAIACTVLLAFSFFKFGLPAAAGYAAHKVPVSASEQLSDGALEFLDRIIFEETQTEETKRQQITGRFNRALTALPDTGDFNYTLHFRSMNGTANAFALPSGDIVVTDALIDMATDEELDSVLFHEIGHVVERHGLEGIIKGSTIAVMVTVALGDLSTVAEMTMGTATFLVQSSYTRAAEEEADDFALRNMEMLDIDPIHFATVMQKLGSQFGEQTSDEDKTSYLSSHPSSASRIEKARLRSEVFNQR